MKFFKIYVYFNRIIRFYGIISLGYLFFMYVVLGFYFICGFCLYDR